MIPLVESYHFWEIVVNGKAYHEDLVILPGGDPQLVVVGKEFFGDGWPFLAIFPFLPSF